MILVLWSFHEEVPYNQTLVLWSCLKRVTVLQKIEKFDPGPLVLT